MALQINGIIIFLHCFHHFPNESCTSSFLQLENLEHITLKSNLVYQLSFHWFDIFTLLRQRQAVLKYQSTEKQKVRFNLKWGQGSIKEDNAHLRHNKWVYNIDLIYWTILLCKMYMITLALIVFFMNMKLDNAIFVGKFQVSVRL